MYLIEAIQMSTLNILQYCNYNVYKDRGYPYIIPTATWSGLLSVARTTHV